MKYLPLNPAIFVKNRKRFIDKMEKIPSPFFIE